MKSKGEKVVSIASDLYMARRVMRDLLGAKYRERIKVWTDALDEAVKKSGKTPTQVVTETAKKMQEEYQDVSMLLAAYVEYLEPTPDDWKATR